MRRVKKYSGGFTLVEIAIVLVIIGLLVGMGAGLMGPLTKRVKLHETRDAVKEAYNAIIGYTVAHKMLPPDLGALGIKTKDAYGKDLLYAPADGLTADDLCTTSGEYLTVHDTGTGKTDVAFIVFSQGQNVCNQTGTDVSFTIYDTGHKAVCLSMVNDKAEYDDIVMYADINYLREQICNTFRITTESLPVGREEEDYPLITLQATDGTEPFEWSIIGQTPGTNGCTGSDYPISSINTGLCLTRSGEIVTAPPPPPPPALPSVPILDGSFNFTVTVTDDEERTASKSLAITINPNDPNITTEVLHSGQVGVAYSAGIAAYGGTGTGTYAWNVTNEPLWLSIDSSTGALSGASPTEGNEPFTVDITDARGRTASKTLSIAISNSSPPPTGCTPTQSPESSCSDGIDNDCDGLTDGADPNCSSPPPPPPPAAPNKLWIGQADGKLWSCDTSATCTDHGDKGGQIQAMAVYSSKVWLGQQNGFMASCDSGLCTEHGDQGETIYSMSDFSGSVWLAHGVTNGSLQACDSSAQCTDYGIKGARIYASALFDSKLWIGDNSGFLLSCDSSGLCTNYGDKGRTIYVMTEYDNKLWLGQNAGWLYSCDNAGACTNHGDKGQHIRSMAVFDGMLWIGQENGILQSCDNTGTCTSRGDKGRAIYAMAVYDSKLWIGHNAGILQSCDNTGTCTSHGDKGNHIFEMVVY